MRLTIPSFAPELDDIELHDIELHKVVVEKVKRGAGIGKFIARMNLFALGSLIIAKHNRVVREEEENERKMIFQSRSRNKLRTLMGIVTDNPQSQPISGVRDLLVWSGYTLVKRLCEPSAHEPCLE